MGITMLGQVETNFIHRRTILGAGGTSWAKVRSFGQWAAATCAAPLPSLPVSTPLQL